MIEVEQGELEMELYFTKDGVLTKEVPPTEDHTDFIPVDIPEAVKADLEKRFPGYELLEAEEEDGEFEVEVIESKSGLVYEFELEDEKQDEEIEISINDKVEIVK